MATGKIQRTEAFLSEDGYEGRKHNNLNTLYADMSDNTFGMSLYKNAANAPRSGDGLVISQKVTDKYGGQFAITDVNVYYRRNANGIWSDWFGINDQIKVKVLNVNYSISANDSYNTNLKTLIDADLPSGHKCIGISGFTTNDINVLPISVRYENSQYSLQMRNISSSSKTEHVDVYYMYTPN